MPQVITMPKTIQQHGPSPELFFATATAYQRSAALKGAIDLEFFTAIAEGKIVVKDLAARVKAPERSVRILADFLVVSGFLTKHGNTYGLTQDSAVFLDKKSPAYLGATVDFLTAPEMMSTFSDVAATVRNGGTLKPNGGTVSPENPIWVDFARAMKSMNGKVGDEMAKAALGGSTKPMKVLDIAGGHGVYGIAFAKANPNAQVTLQDWHSVAAVAEENAKEAGVTDRFHVLAGSAFEVDFGTGFDFVLLTNFLHHFDAPTNTALLKKVYAALNPGGRVITLEFIPNDDRVSPPMAAGFPLVMLASTSAGDAYTYPEFEKMFNAAGFSRNDLHQLEGPQRVIVSFK